MGDMKRCLEFRHRQVLPLPRGQDAVTQHRAAWSTDTKTGRPPKASLQPAADADCLCVTVGPRLRLRLRHGGVTVLIGRGRHAGVERAGGHLGIAVHDDPGPAEMDFWQPARFDSVLRLAYRAVARIASTIATVSTLTVVTRMSKSMTVSL